MYTNTNKEPVSKIGQLSTDSMLRYADPQKDTPFKDITQIDLYIERSI